MTLGQVSFIEQPLEEQNRRYFRVFASPIKFWPSNFYIEYWKFFKMEFAKTCGGGIQTRSRSCSIDPSNYNDSNRPLTEQQSCNNLNCPGKIKWVLGESINKNLITIQYAFVWPQVKTEPFVTMHALMLVPKTGLVVKLHSNIIGELLQPCQEVSEYLNIALTNLTLLMIWSSCKAAPRMEFV